jgi:hypothetical protein
LQACANYFCSAPGVFPAAADIHRRLAGTAVTAQERLP